MDRNKGSFSKKNAPFENYNERVIVSKCAIEWNP